jgi:hypothetical protein
MGTDNANLSADVNGIILSLKEIADRYADTDVGKLALSTVTTLAPSIGRLRLNERKTTEAALISIVSAILLLVAAASRRRTMLDGVTTQAFQDVTRRSVALLGKKPIPRKSIPIDDAPPPSWKASRVKVGGFERAGAGGVRFHITRDIHVSGKAWVLHYSGLMIDTSRTLDGAVTAAAAFEDFLAVAA